MTTEPEQFMIDRTLQVAAQSTCRSKRGVSIYDMRIGAFRGSGFNGPPGGCPGRETCAGTCGQRSVHAEMRALREAAGYIHRHHPDGPYDLIHVELAPDGGVVACEGPRCWQCSREILDVGFIGGVWLYERAGCPYCETGEIAADQQCQRGAGGWRRYTAEEFHRATLLRCGMKP
jgi:hypothetical protein